MMPLQGGKQMRALRLLKDFTPAKNAVHFLVATSLTLIAQTAIAELGNGYAMSEGALRVKHCLSKENEASKAKRDAIATCSEAGLGSVLSTCKRTIENCSEEGSENNPKCLNHTISMSEFEKLEERDDKLRDQISDLQLDLEDTIRERQEAEKLKGEADANLQATLNSVSQGRADALRLEIAKMDEITEQVAQKNDEIDILELELRQFVVEHEMKCRETAQREKDEFVALHRDMARQGRKVKVSQGKFIRNAVLSVKEQGTIKYNRSVKNCMALYHKKGRTGFGTQYRLQKDTIAKKKQILERQKRNLAKQRQNVKYERKKTLLELDALKASALAQNTRDHLNLSSQIQRLRAKQTRLLGDINDRQIRLGAVSGTADQLNQILIALGLQKGQNQSQKRRVATDDKKFEAFQNAQSMIAFVEATERDLANCNGLANSHDDTESTINNLAGGSEFVVAEAVPVDETSRRNSGGQTVIRD
jgi:hypothetical protein